MNQTPNPFVVRASGNEPLPNAAYLAEFVSVSAFANDKITEPRWRWVWRVSKGQYAGREATALTDAKITLQNHAGRLIAGMNGKPLATGDDVSGLIDSFKGRQFLVVVSGGPKGGKPSVQTVSHPVE